MINYSTQYLPDATVVVAQGILSVPCSDEHVWTPTKRIGTRYSVRQCRKCGRKESTWIKAK